MPWIKIDDHFDEHPKLARVGPPGWGYWLAGLAYCNRNLTDGFIPYAVAYNLAGWQTWDAPEVEVIGDDARQKIWTYGVSSGYGGEDLTGEWIVDRMVNAGLWVEEVGGFRVHDFLDYNPSKADVLATRARWANAKKSRRESNVESARESNVESKRPVPVPVPVPSKKINENVERNDTARAREWQQTKEQRDFRRRVERTRADPATAELRADLKAKDSDSSGSGGLAPPGGPPHPARP